MLVSVIDAETGNPIYINTAQLSVIFTGKNPEGIQLTMINLLNGSVATIEPIDEVVDRMRTALKLS